MKKLLAEMMGKVCCQCSTTNCSKEAQRTWKKTAKDHKGSSWHSRQPILVGLGMSQMH